MADEQKVEYLLTAKADAAGTTEMAKAMEDVGKKGAEAQKTVQKEVEKTEISHSKLRQAVKGLKDQFPELAHIAHMALHPVTLLVAAGAASWAIYKKRVEDATKAMAGFELPQGQAMDPGHINDMTKAWDAFGDALHKVATEQTSISTQSDHALANIKQQTEETKKLLAANKNLDLAKLEQNKGGMTEDQYVKSRLAIEDQYSKAGVAADKAGKNEELAEKYKRAYALGIDSGEKMRAAGRIHVASEADDEISLERYKDNADLAKKDIQERQEWIAKMHQSENSELDPWEHMKLAAGMKTRYGGAQANIDDGIKIEQAGIASSQRILDAYYNRLRQKHGRDRRRKEKDDLTGMGTAEGAESLGLDISLPAESAQAAQAAGNASAVAGIESQTRLRTADAEARAKYNAQETEIQSSIGAGRGIPAQMMKNHQDLLNLINSMDAELKRQGHEVQSLKATRAANPAFQ